MAGEERVVAQLVVEGARQFQADFTAAQASVDALTQRLLSVERIRTPQLSDDLRRTAQSIADLAQSGAPGIDRLAQAFNNLIDKLEASRVRTTQLRASLQELQSSTAAIPANFANQNQGARTLTPEALSSQVAAARAQAQARQEAIAGAAAFNAARNAMQQQVAASATLQGRLQALLGTITQTVQATARFATSSRDATAAVTQQGAATDRASRQSITYLSVLSAIHAASFLATNQTFSMIGSFVTLGAAFGKMGIAASAAGLALGGLLGLFGVINNAIQQIQQVAIAGATALGALSVAAAGAVVAAGAAGVKLASDVEAGLAGVRAFGNATAEQLRQVSEQAGQFARQYGVAAADVVQATSLFARAGGTVKEAIEGATEAIVKLQVASQGELQAAQAALLLSAALRQFNLTGEESARVVDSIIGAVQGSALSFIGFQQAFIQAAPGAAALNISVEDLSAAIALLGDQLIKGTTTGTAFKQFILDVVNPTARAKAELAKYGISLQDSSGQAIPFIDAVVRLNEGLGDAAVKAGQVTEAQRATALAVTFGSRAFLAANILTRAGAQGLDEYRDALDAVSTNNVVDVLLLPLSKQLEIAKVNVEELGRAFGGPLLQPLRNATVQAISFFQGLLGPAEVLGQAVSAIATGQGFGQLRIAINDLVGNAALSSFLQELANSFRNIRDVIVSQIIPAIRDFANSIIQAISSQAGLDQIGNTFDGINTAIQRVGIAAGSAIRSLGTLIAGMITGTGEGGKLRTTIEGLANSLLAQLVLAVTTAVAAFQAAVTIMPTLARLSLVVADAALQLAKAFKEVGLQFINFTRAGAVFALGVEILKPENLVDPEAQKRLREAQRAVNKEAELQAQSFSAGADAASKLAGEIPRLIGDVDRLEASLKGLGKAPVEALATARKSVEQIANELIIAEVDQPDLLTQDAVNTFIQRAGAIKQAAREEIGLGLISVVDQLEGSIPDSLANIIAEFEQAQREAQARAKESGLGAPGTEVDQKAIDSAKKRIEEAARDINRRLANLQEDSSRRASEIINRGLERITDILEQASTRIEEIASTAQERITDLFDNIAQRRADRQVLDDFKQLQDDRFTAFQRELDKEVTAEQRALDEVRLSRSRDNEDIARGKEQEIQDDERLFSRMQDVAQRAFDRIAQARQTAFDRAQSAELQAFQRGLDQEATLRQNALALATAKTPEERARVIAQQQQAKADAQFREGQETRLTAFRLAQEDRKLKVSQDAESQAISFRQGLENKAIAERRKNELTLLAFRRTEENKERAIREQEEDKALEKRLAREQRVTDKRRQDALALQAVQDRLENEAAERQATTIREKALTDIEKQVATATRAISEIIDTTTLQLDEQAGDVTKQIRNILQVMDDLKDSLPPEVLAPLFDTLISKEAEVVANAAQVRNALASIRGEKLAELQAAAGAAQASIAVTGADALRRFQPATPTSTVPVSVLTAQTMTVTSLVLQRGAIAGMSQAVLQGLRQAQAEGISLANVDISPQDFGPIAGPLQIIQRYLTGGR